MTISLDELAGLAEKATPGPWRASTDERYGYFVSGSALDWIADMGKTNQAGIDADFIAACDPGTVLKLIAVAKAAKVAKEMKTLVMFKGTEAEQRYATTHGQEIASALRSRKGS